MQLGDEDQSCRRKLVLPHGLKELIQISAHASLTSLLHLCLWRFPFGHKSIQSRILPNFEQFLFTRVTNTKRVQLVKKSFSDLIYVPRIDIFYRFTACRQIWFQIGCSFEESITIRATKGLEDCANIVHVTYMIILSQQSDSILVLLHTPPSQFTKNIPSKISRTEEKILSKADLQQMDCRSYGPVGTD